MDAEQVTEPLSLPNDPAALIAHEKRKKRMTAIGVVIALGALGGGAYAAVAAMGDGMQEVGSAYDALHTCMVGEPLGEGETVEVRMNAIELAIHGMTASERAERGADWPGECTKHAYKLAETASAAAGETEALAETAGDLAAQLEASSTEPPVKTFASLVEAADALSLEAGVDDAVRQPPQPGPRPSIDTLPPTARLSADGFTPGHLHIEPFQSRDVYFLMDEENLPGGPKLCDYRPEGKSLVCRSLPERVAKRSPYLRLWGTTEPGGSPFLYVGDRGKDGIFRSSDGKRIGKKLIYGANAKKSGDLVATFWSVDDQELLLAELKNGDKNPTTEKLLSYEESGNPYYHTGLFWDWFVYRDFDDETDELHLYARRIEGVGKWGKLVDVGPIYDPSKIVENDPPHLDACRDGEVIVVRARGLYDDRLAFYDGKAWHTPVKSTGLAGDLTCFGGEAVITKKTSTEVWQNRCTKSGCERTGFSLRRALQDRKSMLPSDGDPVEAAEAGGSLAVAWRAPKDGLRIIVGKPKELDKTRGELVVDENIADGKLSMTRTVTDYRLIGGRGYAILVVSTIKGNYVFEVRPDGTVTPVTVERES